MFCHWVGVRSLLLPWWNATGNPFISIWSLLLKLCSRGRTDKRCSGGLRARRRVPSLTFLSLTFLYEGNESHWWSACSELSHWSDVISVSPPAGLSVTSFGQSARLNYRADGIVTETHFHFMWLSCQSPSYTRTNKLTAYLLRGQFKKCFPQTIMKHDYLENLQLSFFLFCEFSHLEDFKIWSVISCTGPFPGTSACIPTAGSRV